VKQPAFDKFKIIEAGRTAAAAETRILLSLLMMVLRNEPGLAEPRSVPNTLQAGRWFRLGLAWSAPGQTSLHRRAADGPHMELTLRHATLVLTLGEMRFLGSHAGRAGSMVRCRQPQPRPNPWCRCRSNWSRCRLWTNWTGCW
jgi:hypothetical protein